MMKSICPFCNKKFDRDPRSILSNKFCSRCINQRIIASGGTSISPSDYLIVDKAGYGFFPVSHEGAT